MEKTILAFFTTLLITVAFGQFKPKGTFIGLEELKNHADPSRPNHKWYHLSILTFKKDSVFLEQSPVAIYNGDTIFSVSDGGFYFYAGTIGQYQGKTLADLKLRSCDYCLRQMIMFEPPEIKKNKDTIQLTTDTIATEKTFAKEYPDREFKIMVIRKTGNDNRIMVNKSIYRRQKK